MCYRSEYKRIKCSGMTRSYLFFRWPMVQQALWSLLQEKIDPAEYEKGTVAPDVYSIFEEMVCACVCAMLQLIDSAFGPTIFTGTNACCFELGLDTRV